MQKTWIKTTEVLLVIVVQLIILSSCNKPQGTNTSAGDIKTPDLPYITPPSNTMVILTPSDVDNINSYQIDVIVTVILDTPSAYIDLDNLQNNTSIQTDYDFYIFASGGTNTFISLKPINSATAYWSVENISDYQYCNNLTAKFSDRLFSELLSGLPICIETNGGNIASVQFISENRVIDDPSNIEITLRIVQWK
jgi:hypothetical protein